MSVPGLILTLTLLWSWTLPLPAQAGEASLPRLEISGGDGRPEVEVRLHGGTAQQLHLYAPIGRDEAEKRWELPLREGRVSVGPKEGRGGYYWLQALWQEPDREIAVTTAHYFSRPGPAPTRMLAQIRQRLELIPDPLPREHQRFRTGETWRFLARFDGQPLSGTQVTLHLPASGESLSFPLDEEGVTRVRLAAVASPPLLPASTGTPPNPKPHAHYRHGAQTPFVLSIAHDAGGKHYLTTFAHTCGAPPPGHLPMGIVAALTGMGAGGILWVRRREERA